MREILFRGKTTDTREWVYGFYFHQKDTPIEGHFIIDLKGFDEEVLPETVGQFTGLTDKNGVKIFEGDVLKCVNPNDGQHHITDFISSMVNGFTLKNVKLTRELALYDNDWPDEIEVIGNIHDNPELI